VLNCMLTSTVITLFNYRSPLLPRIFFAAAHVEHICVQYDSFDRDPSVRFASCSLGPGLGLVSVCSMQTTSEHRGNSGADV